MKIAITSIVAALLAGCGTTDRASPRTEARPPAQATPRTGTSSAPPPAWVETTYGSRWLGYSSFCWGTTCADFIAPRCGDGHTPNLVLRPHETVHLHLGFNPTELGLTLFTAQGPGKEQRLKLSRTPTWRVEHPSVFSLFARAKSGDASYVACVRFT